MGSLCKTSAVRSSSENFMGYRAASAASMSAAAAVRLAMMLTLHVLGLLCLARNYSDSCYIQHLLWKRIAGYRSFPDIRMLFLTQFGTWCRVRFAILHYKFAFHHYLQVAHLILKQDWQCPYNITLRRICATFVAVEKQYYPYRVCVCSLNYLPCNAHAPYCHLLPSPFWILSTFAHKRHNFRGKKKVIEHKTCVTEFFYNFCLKYRLFPPTNALFIKT
jgi:hypothetical protein